MGLLKSITHFLGKTDPVGKAILKVAPATAQYWTPFVPGGSIIKTGLDAYEAKRAADKEARSGGKASTQLVPLTPASNLTEQLMVANAVNKREPNPNPYASVNIVRQGTQLRARKIAKKKHKVKGKAPHGLKLRAAGLAKRLRQAASRARMAQRFDHNRADRYVNGKLAPNDRWKAVRARRASRAVMAARFARHVDLRATILRGVMRDRRPPLAGDLAARVARAPAPRRALRRRGKAA
jgi:hypothetical protein